jgi:hypothetical protein
MLSMALIVGLQSKAFRRTNRSSSENPGRRKPTSGRMEPLRTLSRAGAPSEEQEMHQPVRQLACIVHVSATASLRDIPQEQPALAVDKMGTSRGDKGVPILSAARFRRYSQMSRREAESVERVFFH